MSISEHSQPPDICNSGVSWSNIISAYSENRGGEELVFSWSKHSLGHIEYIEPSHYHNSLKSNVRMFEVYLSQYGMLHLYKVVLVSLSFILTKNSIL